MTTMQAAVFQGKGKIGLREVPRPVPGVGQALIKVTLTTICGSDVHILKGDYAVKEGLIVGHEPVGELITHSFRLADIEAAYDLFSNQRDGVMKVAIRP